MACSKPPGVKWCTRSRIYSLLGFRIFMIHSLWASRFPLHMNSQMWRHVDDHSMIGQRHIQMFDSRFRLTIGDKFMCILKRHNLVDTFSKRHVSLKNFTMIMHRSTFNKCNLYIDVTLHLHKPTDVHIKRTWILKARPSRRNNDTDALLVHFLARFSSIFTAFLARAAKVSSSSRTNVFPMVRYPSPFIFWTRTFRFSASLRPNISSYRKRVSGIAFVRSFRFCYLGVSDRWIRSWKRVELVAALYSLGFVIFFIHRWF